MAYEQSQLAPWMPQQSTANTPGTGLLAGPFHGPDGGTVDLVKSPGAVAPAPDGTRPDSTRRAVEWSARPDSACTPVTRCLPRRLRATTGQPWRGAPGGRPAAASHLTTRPNLRGLAQQPSHLTSPPAAFITGLLPLTEAPTHDALPPAPRAAPFVAADTALSDAIAPSPCRSSVEQTPACLFDPRR
ncbi:hypothetical protein ACCO45_011620 [Purpureocillium lilacinum]|uniref:Uncharacterized protein n=1 Tax=Purpureocillium lilacinum TaxID=33203 RepID=A0ACC4DCV6_PURLI